MRPNNPNKRLRGRNRSKNANPLARSYESNGPDVKIRGSALQVADKYAQLARDAQSAGDRVMAENYFQHAEHYYRIVAAAYEQQQPKDRRDDQGERPGRHDERSEQPAINGYDGLDDEDGGVRRTLRGGNGADHHDDGDEDDDQPGPARANGNHYSAPAPAEREEQGAGETGSAEASGEDEAKPKRRSRSTRARRSRKSDANGETQTANADTESAEPTTG